jgi:hypothetical protein
MSSPGASQRHQMERQQREREARELDERTRLKRHCETHHDALEYRPSRWLAHGLLSDSRHGATGCHWLHVMCPACQQMGETDLREIDIHPNASLGTVLRAMSCRRCSPHPPFARPVGATRRSWNSKDVWLHKRATEMVCAS